MLDALQAGALAATRAAALACREHVGRGDGKAADAAAVAAMRAALASLPARGTVVVGEGEKDRAPMLYAGERVGDSRAGCGVDIAVDPLECTEYCAAGLPGSLATIAFAEMGTMWTPGPGFYMDKLVAGPALHGALDISDPPERTLLRAAEALGRSVRDLRVCVLDKPRHGELIARLRCVGAAVVTPSQGDVAGALSVLMPEGPLDLLLGVGGTPEGVMTACAARALGAEMQGRLAPQSEREADALRAAGTSTERVWSRDELITGDAIFAATGVTDGPLLRGPERRGEMLWTHSLLVTRRTVRRVEDTTPDHPLGSPAPAGGWRDPRALAAGAA